LAKGTGKACRGRLTSQLPLAGGISSFKCSPNFSLSTKDDDKATFMK